MRHNLRVFTEYHTSENQRIDVAVVDLDSDKSQEEHHLSDRVKRVVAAVELKFLGQGVPQAAFYRDIRKARHLLSLKEFQECQVYLGFIHEDILTRTEAAWVTDRQWRTWAKGRVTEMTAVRSSNGRLVPRVWTSHE
jgi:hypothetical protein